MRTVERDLDRVPNPSAQRHSASAALPSLKFRRCSAGVAAISANF